MSGVLQGRAALITGANQGLGQAIARAFVQAGADVMLCARDEGKLAGVVSEFRSLCNPGQRVEALRADVSKREDVEQLVSATLAYFPKIQILVNNAGVYGPKGPIDEVDWDEWVQAIEINLLGSILVARALLAHFRAQHYGKIIQLSGGGATAPLPFISAYAASKAGIVRFMETLAVEVKTEGIDVNTIAPGALNTRLLDEVLQAGPEKVGQVFYDRALKQKVEGGAPLERGAELAVYLASPASDGLTGKLISAVWDPWEQFADHADDLNNTDIYTLRRIVPKDRGLDWGEV
ncbi:MAG: SDR family NAD(P)-dependent oxidoreductase [Chloroflexi bacterium]|nr:SDR family NAD(P)-dependent oxidoreductase [Chloroflexota bacterium]